MSGVAEGVAGLTLSAVSVASLFTACIDCFNIVIKAREFGQDYEILCADLALQRLRFCLWGESVGLASRDASRLPVRNPGLDDPGIQPTVTQTLQAIQWLLTQTDASRDRFALPSRGSSTRRLSLFRTTFDQFRTRVRENQTQQSVIGVTKWAIYAGDKFQEKIERLKSLIDGLESVTKSLGVLDTQQSRMHEEINSLNDVVSLKLLRDASISNQDDISDTASRRIMMIEGGSTTEQSGIAGTGTISTAKSFFTAEEGIDGAIHQIASPLVEEFSSLVNQGTTWSDTAVPNHPSSSIAQHRRILAKASANAPKLPQWKAGPKTDEYGSKLAAFNLEDMACSGIFPSTLAYLPEELVNRKRSAEMLWDKPLRRSSLSTAAQRRANRDMKEFKKRETRWTAAAPIYYNLLHLLAAIEGPPDTPYEGGVFFIEIHLGQQYPNKPPDVRF
jgi:hypothetical protein